MQGYDRSLKVNRETAMLRSSLRFFQGEGRVVRIPRITRLPEPPARQGFCLPEPHAASPTTAENLR